MACFSLTDWRRGQIFLIVTFVCPGALRASVRREPDQCPAGMDEGPAGAQDTGVTTKPIMLLVQKFLEKLGYPCETGKRAEH